MPNGYDSNLDITDFYRIDATIGAANDCRGIVINEVVTAPQQDWDDSTDGDAVAFNGTPGSSAATDDDEWIELYNCGGAAVDLTGYRVTYDDAGSYAYDFGFTADGQTLVFSAGGSVAAFQPGEYLVIGSPKGTGVAGMDDDVHIRLDDASAAQVDAVSLGTSLGGDGDASNNAPAGTSTGAADEAIARSPNGVDRNQDDADWLQQAVTIGGGN